MKNKILIGDDNVQGAKSLARALRGRNLEADLTSTPQETIAKARAGNYAVVITDLEYTEGGREGYDVLRAIKDLSTVKILYTGQSGFEYEAEALAEGADYAVTNKSPSRLMEVLDSIDGLAEGADCLILRKNQGRLLEILDKTGGSEK